jgi:hypothetical protein
VNRERGGQAPFTVYRSRCGLERPQLRARLGGHGVAKPVEPGAGIEVLSPPAGLHDHRPMRVAHDDQADRGFFRKKAFGPRALAGRRSVQDTLIESVIAQGRTQEIHEAESEVRVQYSVDSCRRGMMDNPI